MWNKLYSLSHMAVKTVLYAPFDPATVADPYPVYARLRDEAPVFHVEADGVWAVSRYDDVVRVLRDTAIFSSSAMRDFMTGGVLRRQRARVPWAGSASMLTGENRILLSTDPPDHTVLRRLLSRSFTPRAIEARRPLVQRLCGSLMDDLLAAPGPVDFVAAVSWPLPVLVIAEMLGVPADRLDDFKRWSDQIVDVVSGVGAEQVDASAFVELFVFIADLLNARRRQPPGDDLVGVLLEAEGDGGDTLTAVEIAAFCMLLLVAGNETTTSLLGNTLAALVDHRDQLDLLRRRPELVGPALEESLRFDAPFQGLYRTTTEPVDVADVELPPGAELLVMFASANRDERHYREADRFDVTRNPTCLGAALARLEGEVVLRALLERTTDFELAGEITRVPSHVLRSVSSLPLEVVPR